jgi:putative endonuclease
MTRPTDAEAAPRWHVYIVSTARGALYTGITTDVERRFGEHRGGARGARYFRLAAATRVLYVEAHESRSSAAKREAAIKKMTRNDKLALIAASPTTQAGETVVPGVRSA